MSHRAYLTDAFTGLLLQPIELPGTSWEMSVNDSSLTTTPSRKVGVDEVQNITVPWAAVPGDTQREKYEAIEPGRKGLAIFDVTDEDLRDDNLGTPFLWGAISNRESDWDSTTFTVDSIQSIMKDRITVREGKFVNGKSKDNINFHHMTMRGIASEVGYLCTNAKPGGELPVDWSYRGEQHRTTGAEGDMVHERNYPAYNVSNQSGGDIFDKLAAVQDGVDMTFRPYLTADGMHVRNAFIAATDEEQYLGQKNVYSFSCFPGGGTFEKVHVAYAQPYQRVYQTGAGDDSEVLTALSEDLSLVSRSNPYMLREKTFSDTDIDKLPLLKATADGHLDSLKTPYMQISGEFHANDANTPRLGLLWPGEVAELSLQGYPDLPDGVYTLRIMNMSGDETDLVKVIFDVMPNPYF